MGLMDTWVLLYKILKKPQRFVSPDRRQYRWVTSQHNKKRKALGMSTRQLPLELDDSCALLKFLTLAVIKKGDHVGDKYI